MNILYLATADARGHLMRAQLLTHALRQRSVNVEVMTTSDRGAEFLAGFGIKATVLSRHYAVIFDSQQNMLRRETDRNVAQYVFYPWHFLRDMWFLQRRFQQFNIVINDSFHPALLIMGSLPSWKNKIIHVFGSSLREALESNFSGRLPKWLSNTFRRIIAWQIAAAYASITHNFAYRERLSDGERCFYLPTPVPIANPPTTKSERPVAAVYLNPHFKNPEIASAIESCIQSTGLEPHLVCEGFAWRTGWRNQDSQWVDHAADSKIIISSPGMAALSVALVYRKPILLIVTDQPEQQSNAQKAAEMGLQHRTVIWSGDTPSFTEEVECAMTELLEVQTFAPDCATSAHHEAEFRIQQWTNLLLELADKQI